MKIILYLILSISFYVLTLSAQNQWKFITDNAPRLKVYSSYTINNIIYFWCTDNIVYKTSDGGASFQVLSSYGAVNNTALGCCDKHGIAFADSLTGYIADVGHGEFRTTDGGKTWIKKANAGSNISLVEFGSTKVGWKCGDGGFYKTTNAGESWEFMPIPFWQGGVYSNIFSLDDNNVWILKSFHYGRAVEGSIWYSPNGGANWDQLETGLISSDENRVVYDDIYMKKNGFGIAIGRIYRTEADEKKSFIQVTKDFGVKWSTSELPKYYLKDVLSINDSTWIILGNTDSYPDNKLIQLKSIDNGNSWEEGYPFDYSGYNYLYSSQYLPDFKSILVSTVSGMFKSIDEGKTYFRITTDYDIYVKDVVVDKKPLSNKTQTIIARSFNRSYLISRDAGRSWELKEIPTELGYELWIAKISQEVIYIVVDQTRLYKSIDSGTTWVRVNVPVGSGLRALAVLDQNTIVIQGYPNLCTSFNGGSTWTSSPFPGQFWLNESVMLSKNKIVAIGGFYNSGTDGIFYKTSDNGFNWHIDDTPRELEQISMINNKIGYALGSYDFYKTTDAGDSWEVINSANDYSDSFSAFCFQDSLNGLLHSGENFLITEDGGNTWQYLNMNYPFSYINRLTINSTGDLFAVSGGSLLKYSSYFSQKRKTVFSNNNEPRHIQYTLFQNTPNPFNPETRIPIYVSSEGYVTVNIYNLLGQKVCTLHDGLLSQGEHQLKWNGTGDTGNKLASGFYIYQITGKDGHRESKRMLLLR